MTNQPAFYIVTNSQPRLRRDEAMTLDQAWRTFYQLKSRGMRGVDVVNELGVPVDRNGDETYE